MFSKKREYSNKNFIISGLGASLLLSAFIYFAHFDLSYKFINTIFGLFGLFLLLTIPKKALFYAGFGLGILWSNWMAVSLKYYDLVYLYPLVLAGIGIVFGLIFYLFALVDRVEFRVIAIFIFTFISPFGYNWVKPELIFLDSYLGTSKEDFALILSSIYILIVVRKFKFLAIVPLIFALNYSKNEKIVENPPLSIHMPFMDIKQDFKWKKEHREEVFRKNFEQIDSAIAQKKDLVVLPETAFTTVLNKNIDVLDELLIKSNEINIITGGLYVENDEIFNATYFISKGEVQIAKKVVLVPFGEEIPLPKFFVDLINEIFYNGAKDYSKASEPTDFEINGVKFRNAICYEATTDKIFENLNGVKYMIAISNNAWFLPSIEPTLQDLLLRYYSKKYNITIFHVANASGNKIYQP